MGFVDLVVKVYFRGVSEKFPEGGEMSQHMETLRLGDTVRLPAQPPPGRSLPSPQLMFEGPKGRFTYKKRGVFAVKQLPSQACPACRPALVRALTPVWSGRWREASPVQAGGHDCWRDRVRRAMRGHPLLLKTHRPHPASRPCCR